MGNQERRYWIARSGPDTLRFGLTHDRDAPSPRAIITVDVAPPSIRSRSAPVAAVVRASGAGAARVRGRSRARDRPSGWPRDARTPRRRPRRLHASAVVVRRRGGRAAPAGGGASRAAVPRAVRPFGACGDRRVPRADRLWRRRRRRVADRGAHAARAHRAVRAARMSGRGHGVHRDRARPAAPRVAGGRATRCRDGPSSREERQSARWRTKLGLERSVVVNAAGFRVAARGPLIGAGGRDPRRYELGSRASRITTHSPRERMS